MTFPHTHPPETEHPVPADGVDARSSDSVTPTRREQRARERALQHADDERAHGGAAPAPAPAPAPAAAAPAPAADPAAAHALLGAGHVPATTGPLPIAPAPARAVCPAPVAASSPIPSAPRPPGAKSRAHRLARSGVSLAAMAFVGAIAVATCVPANALIPSADVSTRNLVTSASSTTGRTQVLSGEPGSNPTAISHDIYASKVVPLVRTTPLGTQVKLTNDALPGSVRWPLPQGTRISDGFGLRVAPTAGASSNHQGVDFDPGAGAQISAIADGTVRVVQPTDNSGLGVHVIVDHIVDGQVISSVYGHMQIGSIQVAQGQTVTAGQGIGLVGNTGVSTGPHLHFEIRLNGTDAVDPLTWLTAHAR